MAGVISLWFTRRKILAEARAVEAGAETQEVTAIKVLVDTAAGQVTTADTRLKQCYEDMTSLRERHRQECAGYEKEILDGRLLRRQLERELEEEREAARVQRQLVLSLEAELQSLRG